MASELPETSAQRVAKELYTKKDALYHRLFFSILKCDRAMRDFFEHADYVHSGDKILDAGCGSGLVSKILYEISKGKNLTDVALDGFDITPAMLERFRAWVSQNAVSNVKLQQGDILQPEQLPADWEDYDLIVTSAVLEHLFRNDVQKALESLRKKLKKGGKILIFITKTNLATKVLVQKLFKANTYTQAEMEEIVSSAGFGNVTFKTFSEQHKLHNRGVLIVEATN